MSGTFLGLEIARRGIKSHQHSLDITGHNLANASTPGYSRQEGVLKTTHPYTNPTLDSSVTPGQFGTGVAVDNIRRIRDEYLDYQVRRSITDTAYWEDQISVMQRAEASFAEPAAEGIGQRIVDFFKSWMDLNNSPQDPGVKAAVVQLGDSLASLLSYTYNQLTDIEKSVYANHTEGTLSNQLDRVNQILAQVQYLSKSIKQVYDVGQQPNDLLDKRDALLEELSRYGPVKVTFETVNGKPTGKITEFKFFDYSVKQDGTELDLITDGGQIILRVNGGTDDGAEINLTANWNNSNLGGSLLGLERARQNILEYKSMLNDIAVNLKDKIENVNLQAPATDPAEFFTGDLATGDFKVNPALMSNPADIDGTKARDIADLRDDEIAADKPFTFEEYYSVLLTKVGGGSKSASDMAANQSAINKQITALRDSVSGVSIDEELTKMIQFQYGFQASARVTSTINEMLDVIINRLF